MQKDYGSVILAKINYLLALGAGCLIAVMVVTICYDVGARYLLNSPTTWVLEFNEYSLLAIVYLSGAWALAENGHVRVDILYSKFSANTQTRVELFLCLMGIIFTIVFAWQGVVFVYDGIVAGVRSETILEVIQWPIRLIMATGVGLLSIAFIIRFKQFFDKWKSMRNSERVES